MCVAVDSIPLSIQFSFQLLFLLHQKLVLVLNRHDHLVPIDVVALAVHYLANGELSSAGFEWAKVTAAGFLWTN